MIRKIVEINEEKCTGCGLCITGCAEGALRLINGKAKLISEAYCDGLGACLPECPADAIRIVEREADAFDEKAVEQNMAAIKATEEKEIPMNTAHKVGSMACGCPGSMARTIERKSSTNQHAAPIQTTSSRPESELRQWPCQIKLVSPNAPFFENAHLLVAADCTAYAYANIHEDFMKGKITVIGCPKLDSVDYSEKLAQILKINNIKSVSVLRMEVPCCGGIVNAVKQALVDSGKMIPWSLVTIGTDGSLVQD